MGRTNWQKKTGLELHHKPTRANRHIRTLYTTTEHIFLSAHGTFSRIRPYVRLQIKSQQILKDSYHTNYLLQAITEGKLENSQICRNYKYLQSNEN